MSEIALHRGAGSFEFADGAAGPARSIRVFFLCPKTTSPRSHIVIAMHGLDRAASQFRDVFAGVAERNDQIVLVPEFNLNQFPDVYAYNFGGVRLPPPRNTIFPREAWNFTIIDRLFQRVRLAIGSSRSTFGFFGNSAGSQYVLRCLALTGPTAVDVAVASNSGIYMLPDLACDYPTGMGGLGLDEGSLRRFLSKRLVLLLGEADADSAAPDLPRGDVAAAQGAHRLARGRWYFDHCRKLSKSLGVPFGWRLETVPGAGHTSQQIFDRASELLSA